MKNSDDLELVPMSGEKDDMFAVTGGAAAVRQIVPQSAGIRARLDF
jgi:hypothetical protein